MKHIRITEIEVTPEVAAALCPYDEKDADCYSKGMEACRLCPMDSPKDGDLILLRVKKTNQGLPKQTDIMVGS